jgi:hypothetical protein
MAPPSLCVSYTLLVLGGFCGLHHFYLRNDARAFLYCVTFGGCFGAALLWDLFALPELVRVLPRQSIYEGFARFNARFVVKLLCGRYFAVCLTLLDASRDAAAAPALGGDNRSWWSGSELAAAAPTMTACVGGALGVWVVTAAGLSDSQYSQWGTRQLLLMAAASLAAAAATHAAFGDVVFSAAGGGGSGASSSTYTSNASEWVEWDTFFAVVAAAYVSGVVTPKHHTSIHAGGGGGAHDDDDDDDDDGGSGGGGGGDDDGPCGKGAGSSGGGGRGGDDDDGAGAGGGDGVGMADRGDTNKNDDKNDDDADADADDDGVRQSSGDDGFVDCSSSGGGGSGSRGVFCCCCRRFPKVYLLCVPLFLLCALISFNANVHVPTGAGPIQLGKVLANPSNSQVGRR